MPLTTGQVLQARYRIVSLLGEGGMGAVYRVWDLRLKKAAALKEMVPQPGLAAAVLAQYRKQFEQEAVVLAKLKHPNLVPVTDYFVEDGNDYLVMEFVEGESLAARIQRDGALPESDVLGWARQVLDALTYCHDHGVIHRDIKPQNVVITPEGTAVLVDFGLVKLWDPAAPQTKTVMRGMGTPEYAPPEQWGALGYHTDPRSDLYSLGATLYHALGGQAPLTASDRMAYPKRFRTPRELSGSVSEHTDAAITRAMALACDDRWESARAMAEALAAEAQTQPAEALPPTRAVAETKVMTAPTPAPQRRRRAWRWVLVGAVMLALLVVCMVVSVLVKEYERQTARTPGPATPPHATTATAIGGADQPVDAGVLRVDRDARSKLAGYRMTLNWRFELASGATDLLVVDYAKSRDPRTWQATMESYDDDLETVLIKDRMWTAFDDGWMLTEAAEAAESEDALAPYLDLSHEWVAGLKEGDYAYVGDETVNGYATRHFRANHAGNWQTLFKGEQMLTGQVGNVVGDLWIADEADLPAFVVRLVVGIESTANGETGLLVTDQAFTDVNQPITIRPPVVGGLFDQFPLYPNAVATGWSAQTAMFEVAGDVTVENVHTYYADFLSAAGWTLTDDPLVSQEYASSTWIVGERKLFIHLGPGDTEGSVDGIIYVEPAGQ